jgi:hypothetical protein
VSALTLYADGLAPLAGVTRFAEYAVLAAVAVTLASLAVLGVAGLVCRRRRRPQAAGTPATRPAGCLPLVPAARRAPDDLTV